MNRIAWSALLIVLGSGTLFWLAVNGVAHLPPTH